MTYTNFKKGAEHSIATGQFIIATLTSRKTNFGLEWTMRRVGNARWPESTHYNDFTLAVNEALLSLNYVTQ